MFQNKYLQWEGLFMSRLELSEISFEGNDTRHYVIYGYNVIGRMLLKALRSLNISVDCFLCSNGYKKYESVEDFPVYEIDEYANNKNNIKKDNQHIVVTVQNGQNEVLRELDKRLDFSFSKINNSDFIDICGCLFESYVLPWKMAGDKYISLNGAKFLNPYSSDKVYFDTFFYGFGDLISTSVYNDLSYIYEGPYELPNVSVDEDDVVFDLGSNVGLFAAAVAGRCKKIYAFEPLREAYKYISELAEICPNIELCKYAVGDYTGKAEFFDSDDLGLGSGKLAQSHFNNSNVNDKRNMVDIITIDDFVEKNNVERVDYIKADIEGAERDMLRGAMKTLRKFAPKISICEYHLKDDPEVLESLILEANPNYIVSHKYMKIYAYVPK